MIIIFKNKNDIPMDMEYVELNDIYFNQNTALMLDEEAKKLIEVIDGAKLFGVISAVGVAIANVLGNNDDGEMP